jgi:hypothetical protein
MPTNVKLRYLRKLFIDLPVAETPKDDRLYVLFHGLVSLVQGPKDEFRAFALAIGPDHQYRLGSWLHEDRMPKGTRGVLRGVSAAPKTKSNVLNPKLNPTIALKAWPDANDPDVWASFSLPRPRKIHYQGLGKAEVVNSKLLIHPSPKACGLTVFEYKVSGPFEDLQLASTTSDEIFWKATAFTEFPEGGPKIATLHVFNSPSSMPNDPNHSVDEFALSAKFLGRPEVSYAKKPVDLDTQPELPGGLSSFEAAPLSHRTKFVDKLVDFARTARFTASHGLNDDGCKSCCSAADGDFDR